MSTINTEATVGQLVAERPSRARIFEMLGIDYCCGGKKPLGQACQEKGLDANTVVLTLTATEANNGVTREKDWTTASLSDLIDNILAEHHDYLREEMPRISFLAQKVANAHGDRNPAMVEVAQVFEGFRAEMEMHMAKEENVLFPMIRQIESGNAGAGAHCGSIRNPIFVMEREHDSAGNALEAMHQLTDGYTLPSWGCNTYRALLDALATLEENTHNHVHKENNILFPRAIAAEGGEPINAWNEAPIAL